MRFRLATFLTVALLLISVSAHADSLGRVSGRVLDQTGAALPGVAIDLVLAVNGLELTTVTDNVGGYRFEDVPPGDAVPSPAA